MAAATQEKDSESEEEKSEQESQLDLNNKLGADNIEAGTLNSVRVGNMKNLKMTQYDYDQMLNSTQEGTIDQIRDRSSMFNE